MRIEERERERETYLLLSLLRVVHKDHCAQGKERGAQEGEFRGAGHVGRFNCVLLQGHCRSCLNGFERGKSSRVRDAMRRASDPRKPKGNGRGAVSAAKLRPRAAPGRHSLLGAWGMPSADRGELCLSLSLSVGVGGGVPHSGCHAVPSMDVYSIRLATDDLHPDQKHDSCARLSIRYECPSASTSLDFRPSYHAR